MALVRKNRALPYGLAACAGLIVWWLAAWVGRGSEWTLSFGVYIPGTIVLTVAVMFLFRCNPILLAVVVAAGQTIGVLLRGDQTGDGDGLWVVHIIVVLVGGLVVWAVAEQTGRWSRLRDRAGRE